MNLYPNLVIFTSDTSVEFVIFFLCLQPQLLQIHLSPENLTIAIHFTLASHKQISTNFNAFKIHWHVSLQTLQNINTSHQYSKKLHWLPIKQKIDNKLCLLTYKTLTNQQPTYLYNILSFPSHSVSTRSSDSPVLSIPYVRSSLGKRLSLSSVHDSVIHSLLIPETCLLYQYSVPGSKHTFSKLRSPYRLFPISLDCLSGFWFLLSSFYAISNDT